MRRTNVAHETKPIDRTDREWAAVNLQQVAELADELGWQVSRQRADGPIVQSIALTHPEHPRLRVTAMCFHVSPYFRGQLQVDRKERAIYPDARPVFALLRDPSIAPVGEKEEPPMPEGPETQVDEAKEDTTSEAEPAELVVSTDSPVGDGSDDEIKVVDGQIVRDAAWWKFWRLVTQDANEHRAWKLMTEADPNCKAEEPKTPYLDRFREIKQQTKENIMASATATKTRAARKGTPAQPKLTDNEVLELLAKARKAGCKSASAATVWMREHGHKINGGRARELFAKLPKDTAVVAVKAADAAKAVAARKATPAKKPAAKKATAKSTAKSAAKKSAAKPLARKEVTPIPKAGKK